MNKVLPTMPVSDLRTQQANILGQLKETPILLTQRGQGAGVLVHPDTWNKLIEQLEHLRHLELLRQRSAEIARGEFVTFEELEQELDRRGLLDA
jgi:PHD/YefM family antitoxin component YafN of YafNO toxin-antitoxin module